jgi:hypothetical protein
MSDTTSRHAGLAVRASDAEREHTVALLQHGFTDGRLTRDELEERAGAAYAARTTAELTDLTADLPAQRQPPRPGRVPDRRLLFVLLCVHPPAGLVYWLLSLRRRAGRPGPEPTTAPARERAGCARPSEITDTTARSSSQQPVTDPVVSAAGGDLATSRISAVDA